MMTTRRAGRLSPCASPDVQQTTGSMPCTKRRSTARLLVERPELERADGSRRRVLAPVVDREGADVEGAAALDESLQVRVLDRLGRVHQLLLHRRLPRQEAASRGAGDGARGSLSRLGRVAEDERGPATAVLPDDAEQLLAQLGVVVEKNARRRVRLDDPPQRHRPEALAEEAGLARDGAVGRKPLRDVVRVLDGCRDANDAQLPRVGGGPKGLCMPRVGGRTCVPVEG